MGVTGVCQICESAEARHACERCGMLVCADHYDPELGFCADCAARIRRARGEGSEDVSGTDRRL